MYVCMYKIYKMYTISRYKCAIFIKGYIVTRAKSINKIKLIIFSLF